MNESSNPLAKNVLAPLGITAAASAFDAGIQKKKNMVLVVLRPLLRKQQL